MFDHFLFTRFNLRYESWETTISGNVVLSDEWLTERFRLFKTYCLPSVKNQTNQEFKWFIFFDTETPDHFKEEISRLKEYYSVIHPVFLESGTQFKAAIITVIRENIAKNKKYVLSSRIDNDDIIHKDYIQTVQHLFQPINNHVIDLPTGYQLIAGNKGYEILKFDWPFNPFISLIETLDNAKSVFTKEHKEWQTSTSVTSFVEKRLWMQVVHKNNLLNHKRKLKEVYKIAYRDFGLKESEMNLKHPVKILLTNTKVGFSTFLTSTKIKIKRLLKGKR